MKVEIDRKHVVAKTIIRAFGLVFSLYQIVWAAPAKVYYKNKFPT